MADPGCLAGRISGPWAVAFELAWEAHCSGSPGVGAVVTDADDTIVARGRSRRGERTGVPNQLSGSRMAHAEINALAGLTPDQHEGLRLLVTLEPCLLCVAAVAISHVREVAFAGVDPMWQFVQTLPERDDRLAERWPSVTGPIGGAIGAWASLVPLLERLERDPQGPRLDAFERERPSLLTLARELVADGTACTMRQLSLDQALETVWSRLPG